MKRALKRGSKVLEIVESETIETGGHSEPGRTRRRPSPSTGDVRAGSVPRAPSARRANLLRAARERVGMAHRAAARPFRERRRRDGSRSLPRRRERPQTASSPEAYETHRVLPPPPARRLGGASSERDGEGETSGPKPGRRTGRGPPRTWVPRYSEGSARLVPERRKRKDAAPRGRGPTDPPRTVRPRTGVPVSLLTAGDGGSK